MTENADTVHGRLLESVHIAGYTWKRACDELDWMLDDNRWQQVGSGYTDINDFLGTIDLSEFRIAVDQRKGLSRKLKELEATNVATAMALGVDEGTIRNDTRAEHSESTTAETPVQADIPTAISEVSEQAWFQQDLDHADLAKANEKQAHRAQRDRQIANRRSELEAKAKAEIAAADDLPYEVVVADIEVWRPAGVQAIITDPPYITENAVELHRELADFAVDVLPEGGALVVMTWQPILPDVLDVMTIPGLVYRWAVCWKFGTSARTPERKPRVFDGWKPVLVFHKGSVPDDVTYLYDVIESPDASKEHHEWGQSPEGFQQLVRAFTQPGDIVCDPFVGGGTTAIAALAESRRFIGADIDQAAVAKTVGRLSL